MGCFGDMEDTKQVTSGPPQWVQDAGQANYNQARAILDQGFQPYTGSRVAPLSQNEQAASDLIANTAASGNPYSGTAASDFTNYGAAPGYTFDFNTIVDPNGPLGSIQNYMNPYLDAVLAPALRQLGISGAQARQGINANATLAGAYGDARHGVVESEQRKNQAQQETDVVGKAWSDAFNTALSQRQQDAARQFQTQQAQAAEDKATLERMRTSGIDLTNLDKYDTGRAIGLASALGQTGANERSVDQAQRDFDFEEFMRQQGFTDNQVAFLTSILKGTPTTTTQTTSQPDNSGWQAVGAGVGALPWKEIGTMAASLFL